MHGELLKVRSTKNESLIYNWRKDLKIGDLAKDNTQLRPHIVWFGEDVPMLDKAIELTEKAAILIIIGTSMQVYPAANLINFTKPNTPIYFIDPKPSISEKAFKNISVYAENASTGVPKVVTELLKEAF